jgi:hypothetical protein
MYLLSQRKRASYLRVVLLKKLCQPDLIGTLHFINLGASLEKLKGGHCLDTAGSGDIVGIVDIDLDEFHIGVFTGHLFENRANVFTGSAPKIEAS